MFQLNLVESLCVPPAAGNSTLSKLSLQLLKNDLGTDMEFEVVVAALEASGTESCDAVANAAVEEEKFVIRAHRVIVAARCDWFRRALLSGMREAIDKLVSQKII